MQRTQRHTILLGLFLMLCGAVGLWVWLPDFRLRYTVQTDSELFYVAVSPDGQLLATSGLDGNIQLWNAANGTLIRTLQGHIGQAALAFHPSGERLVSAGRDATVRLWSVASGQQLNLLWTNPPAPGYGVPIPQSDGSVVTEYEEFISVDVSPNGNLIAVGSDIGRVIIFRSDLSVSQIISVSIERSDRRGYPASSIDISQDNQLLLVDGAYGVRLWDLSKQRPIKHLTRETTKGLLYTPGHGQFRSNSPTIRTFFSQLPTTKARGLVPGAPLREAAPRRVAG